MTNEREPSQPPTTDTSSPASASPTSGSTADTRNISTGGGTYVEGNLHQEGVIVGGEARINDSTIIGKIEHSQVTFQQEELAYNVSGLENPYLGLRSFGYEDRAKYAGRDPTIAAGVNLLTTPRQQCTLLFITGAS